MKSCFLAYMQQGRSMCCFFLIAVIGNLIVVVFWFINFSNLFLKILTKFLRLLSAVRFRDLFEIRIMNFLSAIDAFSVFSPYQYFDHLNYYELFLTLSNVFNNIKFCCILFLLVTVVKISPIFRSDSGR